MIDMHYDLLSIIYKSYLENDFSKVKKWLNNYNKNNISGLIANMYFMSYKEMEEELHPKYYNSNISVLEMFKISVSILKSLTKDKNIDILLGIEGCDYIKNEEELEELYNLGLRSICIVWNEENKYGRGIRYKGGLTEEGKRFIYKAIELGIGIDLSHTNEETFTDIINIVKKCQKTGFKPIVYASHSNSRYLCDVPRNLTDKQIIDIRSVDGYIGLMSNRKFINLEYEKLTNKEIRQEYIKHIKYVIDIVDYDHILVSTDDMTFLGDINDEYRKRPIYNYANINDELKKDLNKIYPDNITNNIMYGNAKKIFDKLNNNKNYPRNLTLVKKR